MANATFLKKKELTGSSAAAKVKSGEQHLVEITLQEIGVSFIIVYSQETALNINTAACSEATVNIVTSQQDAKQR